VLGSSAVNNGGATLAMVSVAKHLFTKRRVS
jgi:hypothetical protein